MKSLTLNELRTMLRCVLSAGRRKLSAEQIGWLMVERGRCDYFLTVMRGG
jgi:hypothetical protein